MTKRVTLGGDRLGAGNKNKVYLHGFERSNHNLSRVVRTTMTSGICYPIYTNLFLPGDKIKIKIKELIRTAPTSGALMGSFKFQCDMFAVPIRLYNGLLHNNAAAIGLKMNQIKFPKFELQTKMLNPDIFVYDIKNSQISPSSLWAYVGLRGLGTYGFPNKENNFTIEKDVNALPIFAYWDILKNYYSNKQEKRMGVIDVKLEESNTEPQQGFVTIHTTNSSNYYQIDNFRFRPQTRIDNYTIQNDTTASIVTFPGIQRNYVTWRENETLEIKFNSLQDTENLLLVCDDGSGTIEGYNVNTFGNYQMGNNSESSLTVTNNKQKTLIFYGIDYFLQPNEGFAPYIKWFPIENIDNLRYEILKKTGFNNQLIVNEDYNHPPYNINFENTSLGFLKAKYKLAGLGIKTYLSDIFNNWLNTADINEINRATTIDVSNGLTMDALNLQKRVYNMLNRISLSGDTYENWLEAVYDIDVYKRPESPIYIGGMSSDIQFEEIVSTADSINEQGDTQPLGTLAGWGKPVNEEGGYIEYDVNEPSLIMAIASITPRIDYSQGNRFYLDIMSPNEFHKPNLDQIGFQDLLTERACWYGRYKPSSDTDYQNMIAGKTIPWIDYMTDYNEILGDFAESELNFMVLDRNYKFNNDPMTQLGPRYTPIKDFTTYVDPQKYNEVFATNTLDASNFWVQVGFDIFARRKMSASQIPNV